MEKVRAAFLGRGCVLARARSRLPASCPTICSRSLAVLGSGVLFASVIYQSSSVCVELLFFFFENFVLKMVCISPNLNSCVYSLPPGREEEARRELWRGHGAPPAPHTCCRLAGGCGCPGRGVRRGERRPPPAVAPAPAFSAIFGHAPSGIILGTVFVIYVHRMIGHELRL